MWWVYHQKMMTHGLINIYIYTRTLYFQRTICNVWGFTNKKTWNYVFNQQTYRIELVNNWINGMLGIVWEFSTWMAKLWTGTLKIWTWHGLPGEKNNNQKYEIPILKVVGPSMLIATDPKFQFGFAVQMWKVVEKPFIWVFLAKTYVNMKFKTGETDFGYVHSTHRIPDTSD